MKRNVRIFLYWLTVVVMISLILIGIYVVGGLIIEEALKAAVRNS